jgi:hypothetical protein
MRNACSKTWVFKVHTTVQTNSQQILFSWYSRQSLRYMVEREGRLNLGGGTPSGTNPTEQTIVVEEHGGVKARMG